MDFSQLLQGTGASHSGGDPQIKGLDYNSMRIQPGWAFVAMRGESSDGNRYIDAALKQGAVAVVSDSEPEPHWQNVPWAVISHGRRALAQISANFYAHPAEKLKIIGITGTNGKTTTTFLCESILRYCKRPAALIGTIEYHVPVRPKVAQAGAPFRVLPSPHTTPEALELSQIFAQAVEGGATHAAMEVSSHALVQERVWGIPYEVAVFTNLTRDHLDYHKDMESYFKAKSLLFLGCGARPPRAAVINADDEYGRILGQTRTSSVEKTILYGIHAGDFRAIRLDLKQDSTLFELATSAGSTRIETALLGGINVYNILAAAAATFACGCPLEEIAEAIRQFKQVPGRFEKVDCGQPFTVVVDYAHTDDALRNLTAIARDFARRGPSPRRVITVFGCGGDRDRTKRPLMAEAAGQGSDFVVLTSDNPRSEDPGQIIQDALPGLKRGSGRFAVEPDRKQAIQLALREAQPGDVVLIAGKGHEKVQITREGVFPFDDVQVAREALQLIDYARDGGAR
ncbi:MAG TPA: UDP-N-acetylmuramoyl-L-alanyl-D-glutamate--2,6-diaminopimelate ligase [Candidatus Sulfotelmatobacter sp.]|nr:UDP-N-acetylmuramoyl-L-alanyl-D-glutamate--2,6-diaminopimelate ligase [Candidatus Sulfotelmatobacter sp.]